VAELFELFYRTLDGWLIAILPMLAVYLSLSGIDDLFIDVAWIVMRYRHPGGWKPPARQSPTRRIAVFVPLWREHEVIAQMLAHNIAAIRYPSYTFFAGAYPNDDRTLEAVRGIEARYPNVTLAVCPHDGPTSKADCLNWIYQHMLLYEERTGQTFDLVVTHDAEDLIHPDAFDWMNTLADRADFIQVPVLALETPSCEITHGVYCDEFAEFQTRDLPVRNWLGGFIPSAGVGTAYSRGALQALAESSSNQIFEPGCLTEDYENGCRLHALGFTQVFVPPLRSAGGFVATREYFPRDRRTAIRQRTRWVTGIALQGWQRHGWRGGWRQVYWFWRDRKGLVSSPLTLLTNLLTIYAAATGMWDRVGVPAWIATLCALTLLLLCFRLAVRACCTARVYGWPFAALVPLRAIHANWINAVATASAIFRFARARWRGEPLVWVKTSHCYPTRDALCGRRRRIGEILTGSGYITEAILADALATQPAGVRIGEHLIALGRLTEDELYEALSIQEGLPLGAPDRVQPRVARSLPDHVMREWKVLPFQVSDGMLRVAASEVPTAALHRTLRGYTSLNIEFHLVTPAKLESMMQATR
jgi:adsorption protein B